MIGFFKKRFYLVVLVCLIVFAVGCKVKNEASGSASASECRPSFTVPARSSSVHYLDFMAVGDTGGGNDNQRSVAWAMADYAGVNPVEFVLLLGDNFYPSGVNSVDDPKFETHFETIYDQTALDMPFHVVAGNHDYKGNVQAQVAYTDHSSRWHMPGLYYTFTIRRDNSDFVQFFALDTTPIAQWKNVDEQLSWLEDELSRSRARWKIVFGHHPIYSNGKHGNGTRMSGWVFPLLEIYGVDVYMCGHDHDLQVLKPVTSTGVHYLVAGTGSSYRDTQCKENTVYSASRLGFMGFRISNDQLVVFVVLNDGSTDYCHVISK